MAISSGFFDSVNGDRTYDADQMSNYFDGLVSDGVYETIGDRFLVTAGDGMRVKVGSGRAIIQSRWVKNDAEVQLTLDTSNASLNRMDAIVLRLDKTARTISLVVKKGTAVDGVPSMPAITRNDTVYELYLATVYVAAGAPRVGTITDMRPSSYCGWVTGVVKQVDTSDLFLQYEQAYAEMYERFSAFIADRTAEFDAWFRDLTQQLTVDAGFVKYQEFFNLPPRTDYLGFEIQIGIPEYDPEEDALLVYLDGSYLIEGYHYEQFTSSTLGNAIRILLPLVGAANKKMALLVFKNIIGKNVLLPDSVDLVSQSTDFGSSLIPQTITNFEPIQEG